MDTVVGPNKSYESCILTLLFTTSNFLIVFKLMNTLVVEKCGSHPIIEVSQIGANDCYLCSSRTV